MESRYAYCNFLSHYQCFIIRHATSCSTSRHSSEVCIISSNSRLGRTSFPTHLLTYPISCCSFLSYIRHPWRMGHDRQFLQGNTGLPYRCTGYGTASNRRVSIIKIWLWKKLKSVSKNSNFMQTFSGESSPFQSDDIGKSLVLIYICTTNFIKKL